MINIHLAFLACFRPCVLALKNLNEGAKKSAKLAKKLDFIMINIHLAILACFQLCVLADTQILDKKIELIQWLSSLEDKNIIEKLVQIRQSETKGWWEAISKQEENSILKGIDDADNNKLNPHSSARKIYEKWL